MLDSGSKSCFQIFSLLEKATFIFRTTVIKSQLMENGTSMCLFVNIAFLALFEFANVLLVLELLALPNSGILDVTSCRKLSF